MRARAVARAALVAEQVAGLDRLPAAKAGCEGVEVGVAHEPVPTAGGPDLDHGVVAEAASWSGGQGQQARRSDLSDRSPGGTGQVDAGVEVGVAMSGRL